MAHVTDDLSVFVAELIDHSDDQRTIEKAVAILLSHGYNKASIALLIDEAYQQSEEFFSTCHATKNTL